ncbi:MAG: Tfp pilus assembly protein PilF [Planctomycetota bacterium]|jgi:Tfp pilus assembly protein PilF
MNSDRRSLLIALLIAGALWVGSTWSAGFSLDDHELLFRNPVIEGKLPWSAVFDRDYWHHQSPAGHWRPLVGANFRIERALFGEWAGGYHLTAVLAHLIVMAMAWSITTRLWPRPARITASGRDPLLGGLLLLAVHPSLADAVAWISGKTSAMSAIGGLLGAAWLCSLEGREKTGDTRADESQRSAQPSRFFVASLASFIGLALALMGKEDGLIFAPVYLLIALRHSRKRALSTLVGSATAIAAWLLARHAALGVAFPTAPYALLDDISLLERVSVGAVSFVNSAVLMLLPLPHSPTITAETLRAESLDARAWIVIGGTLLLIIIACVRVLRRHSKPTRGSILPSLSLLLLIAAWLPHLQLIPSAELFAPRFLYLPLILGIPFFGQLASRVPKSIGVMLLGILLPLSWQQAQTYHSRVSYWEQVLRFDSNDARAYNALGSICMEGDEPDRAQEHFERALEIRPRYARALVNLGCLHMELERPFLAEDALLQATRLQPGNAKAWGNLGVLYLRQRMFEEAELVYKQAVQKAPGIAALWRGLGRAQQELEQLEAARAAFTRAIELDPSDRVSREALQSL